MATDISEFEEKAKRLHWRPERGLVTRYVDGKKVKE